MPSERACKPHGRGPEIRGTVGMAMVLGVLGVLVVLGGCDRPTTTETPAEAAPVVDDGPDAPIEPEEPSNRAAGETLELTLARADGSATDLTAFAGRPVLLVVDASWSDDWADGLSLYGSLRGEHPDLAVVVVVVDEDPAAIDAVEANGLTAAWDPQGAVAAQLSAATFPTLIVLDGESRVIWQAKSLDVAGLRDALK